jgi:hypothetical protein
MITGLYFGYAVAQLSVWLWGMRLYLRRQRPLALLLVLIPSAPLWFDNLRIGLGRFLGEGELLYALSVPALVWHYLMLPLFVLAVWALGRSARIPLLLHPIAGVAFALAALGLFLLDAPYAVRLLSGELTLKIGCIGDAIRYTATLSPAYLCGPEDAVHRVGPGPLVAILMNAAVLFVGIALARVRGYPWLLVSASLMFALAAAGPAFGAYAAPLANFGEVVFVAGLIAATAHFGPRRLL